MKKIINISLDERPCTYDFPNMIGKMAEDINLVTIPREYLGQKKIPGDIAAIQKFILEEGKDASYAIIAIDTLLYGGIVPSRLHYKKEEELMSILDVLKQLKKENKNIKIFAFHLIMRCPSYSSNDEEPDFYELCGQEIHNLGYYDHLKEVRKLNDEEQKEYDRCKEFITKNDYQKYVDDYLSRRKINTNMNQHVIDLVNENIIDFLVIPQDDSAPYGLTAIDQMKVRSHINKCHLESKVLMYPDADAVSNVLLARAINEINNVKPKVFVRYSTCNEGNIIPRYEDRPVSESIKYQILASGGMEIDDYSLSDMVLMVNLPLKDMLEARHLYDSLKDDKFPGEKDLNYTVGRNLVEFVEYIKYLVSIKKCVGIADIAYANGSDTILVNMLHSQHLLFKVNSYAGWNTAANTLGTCIPLMMVNHLYGMSNKFLNFMGLRYLEDCGYQSNVRFDAFDYFKEQGFDWKEIDGKEDGKVATYIKNNLIKWAKENLDDEEYKVELVKHYQPWNRFFETGIEVEVKQK